MINNQTNNVSFGARVKFSTNDTLKNIPHKSTLKTVEKMFAKETKGLKEILQYLAPYGVSPNKCIKIHKKLDVPLAHLRSLGSLCSRFATAHTFATLRYAFGALHSAHAFTTKQSPKSIKIKFCNPH